MHIQEAQILHALFHWFICHHVTYSHPDGYRHSAMVFFFEALITERVTNALKAMGLGCLHFLQKTKTTALLSELLFMTFIANTRLKFYTLIYTQKYNKNTS